MEGKVYWLISAPKTREDTFNTLNKKTADENDLSVNYKFSIPDGIKVGTLDSLMSLSDELNKIDAMVEATTRKIATQLFDLIETPKNTSKYDSLTVANNNIDTYLTFFKWDEAKYPISQSLKSLTELIQAQVGKLDEELKVKAAEYNNLVHSLHAEERKQTGNLLVKDLSDVVKKSHVVETEFMETIFVAVPGSSVKPFLKEYERLSEMVLPRSAELVAQDSEFHLYRVIVFRKTASDFKLNAREKKYIAREFAFKSDDVKGDKKKVEEEREKLKKNLIRWTKVNFSEAFIGWTHLKAIRTFVESVLRYGLPTNFQAMLLLPHKGKSSKLRKVLGDLYGHLSSKSVFSKDNHEDEGSEGFFPYVSLDINLDFRSKTGL